MEDDLTQLSIAHAARLLAGRQISAVELTESHLRRIERLNPTLNAFITITAERALVDARTADDERTAGVHRGDLHGIPFSLKDVFRTKGVTTTAGSSVLRDYVPRRDSTVAQRLRDAGAVLLGKCNTHEFALGPTNINPFFGSANNPRDLDRISGGSSGGSAVAVAAELSMTSIGSDGGGSIRIPASFCGCVGLKPTYGRVSRYGVFPVSPSLDACGPLTRTVEDAALVLEAIAGADPRDITASSAAVPSYRAQLGRGVRGLRIGIPSSFFFDIDDEEVDEAVRRALASLEELGAVAVSVSLPTAEHSQDVRQAYFAETARFHRALIRRFPECYSIESRSLLENASSLPESEFARLEQLRASMKIELAAALDECDAIAAPTCPGVAPRREQEAADLLGEFPAATSEFAKFTRFANLTGAPAISVPCGFTSIGLPVGLQLIGKPFGEGTLLCIAAAYEAMAGLVQRPISLL
jgi:aspartyl-tRNA(Asn)/glutamyl-tRNA(Gln) amidotransferase subunit A